MMDAKVLTNERVPVQKLQQPEDKLTTQREAIEFAQRAQSYLELAPKVNSLPIFMLLVKRIPRCLESLQRILDLARGLANHAANFGEKYMLLLVIIGNPKQLNDAGLGLIP